MDSSDDEDQQKVAAMSAAFASDHMRLSSEEESDPESVFELLEKLGEGSYGSVWRAKHRASGKEYAIKRVPVENDLEALQVEIEFMKSCVSPFIVQYFGSYIKANELWIVMEYAAAGSVADLMKATQKVLTEPQIAIVCKSVLLGLQFLHGRKKLHRDIKAGNVLLNEKGEGKLADFGVSGQLADTMAKRHTVIGTPFWMAPEVIQEIGYDSRADIWSLGITCIELAEGRPPYSNVHPMRAIFMIPSRPPPTLTEPTKWSHNFNDFVAQCLTKDPKARPHSTDLLEHPFVNRVKGTDALVELIKEQQEVIATVGREKALGLERAEDTMTRPATNPTGPGSTPSPSEMTGTSTSTVSSGTSVVHSTATGARLSALRRELESKAEEPEEDGDEDGGTGTMVVNSERMNIERGATATDPFQKQNKITESAASTASSQWLEHMKQIQQPVGTAKASDQPRPYADWTTDKLKKAVIELDDKCGLEVHAIAEKYKKYRQAVTKIIEEKRRTAGQVFPAASSATLPTSLAASAPSLK